MERVLMVGIGDRRRGGFPEKRGAPAAVSIKGARRHGERLSVEAL
jgi:hypothetical protein